MAPIFLGLSFVNAPLVAQSDLKDIQSQTRSIKIAAADMEDIDAQKAQQQQQVESELEILQNEIADLQKSLKLKRKQQSNALKQLRISEKNIATVAKILKSTSRQIKNKTNELRNLDKQKSQFEHNRKAQKQALAKQLRSAYMNGKQEYLKLLLNQQDPDELGRMLIYYDYMNKARSEQVKELQKTLTDLSKVNQSITKEIGKLELLKKSKLNEQKQLTSLKIKRQKLVNQLKQEISVKSDTLTELEINAQELQQLVDSVVETVEEIVFTRELNGLQSYKGKMNWPLTGKQLQKYGSRKQGQRSSGVMIAAKEGAEVLAISHGRVVYSDWLRGFGLLLIVDHGKGFMSLYGYNQALYREVGDYIESGDVIAITGQSGGQKQPALYFELRHKGKPINPKRWFR
ncbi:MAG: murein hydrolase activator EnvC family protein [Kangiellaceae bacterium]